MSRILTFDQKATAAIRAMPHIYRPLMLAVTHIGLPPVVVGVASLLAIALITGNERSSAIAAVLTVIALGLNTLLKIRIRRARPETLYVSNMRFKSYSFPSGHAFGSLLVYSFAGLLSLKYIDPPYSMLIAILLLVLIFLIGLSRVYLGAHYVFDVLGGWLFASMTLFVIQLAGLLT